MRRSAASRASSLKLMRDVAIFEPGWHDEDGVPVRDGTDAADRAGYLVVGLDVDSAIH